MTHRINLSMSIIDILMALGGGNPGGLRVAADIYRNGATIDPDSALGGLGHLLLLDTHGIYEHRIWMLYKDVCGEDLVNTIAMLRAVQLGFLSEDALNCAIDGDRGAVNVAAELKEVQEYLPGFGRFEKPMEQT